MKSLPGLGTGIVLLLAVAAGAAPPDRKARTSATVQVTIRVAPYAEVNLSEPKVDVELGPNQRFLVVDVAGTVTCNCNVTLLAEVTPPRNAPGRWRVQADPDGKVDGPGRYELDNLLRVYARLSPKRYRRRYLLLVDTEVSPEGETPPAKPKRRNVGPDVGQVILTIVPTNGSPPHHVKRRARGRRRWKPPGRK